MNAKTIWLYIVVMAGVTYLIRMLPLALLRKKLRSRFIKKAFCSMFLTPCWP